MHLRQTGQVSPADFKTSVYFGMTAGRDKDVFPELFEMHTRSTPSAKGGSRVDLKPLRWSGSE